MLSSCSINAQQAKVFEMAEQLREQQNVIVRLELQLVTWRSAVASSNGRTEGLAPLLLPSPHKPHDDRFPSHS